MRIFTSEWQPQGTLPFENRDTLRMFNKQLHVIKEPLAGRPNQVKVYTRLQEWELVSEQTTKDANDAVPNMIDFCG